MHDVFYSLPLMQSPDGEYRAKAAGVSAGLYSGSLGTNYADSFQRDRAPSQLELLGNLVGTAFRCCNLNSNLVASTRLRAYVQTRKGDPKAKFVAGAELMGRQVTRAVSVRTIKGLRDSGATKSALLDAVDSGGDVEEVTSHPLLDLLGKPEDTLTDGGLSSYDHRWTTQIQLESVGRSYWYVAERDKLGQPKRLQLLRSHLVREIPDPTGNVYILRYEYGTAKIDPADIIRFALPDPSNPHLGFLPPMRAAIERIRLVRGGDAFTSAVLENGGYPAGIWSPKGDSEGGGIGEHEAKRMASEFRRKFAMANAGKIFVSESPGALQTLAWKPAEIIDIARSQEIEGQIADCFDVPRTKMWRDSSNKASSESGDAAHAKDAGLPRCSRFEEVLNGQLVPLFDTTGRLFLAFDSPVPADKVFELEQTKTGGSLGLNNLDEGRAAIGMDPIGGMLGKSRVVSNAMVLVSPDGTVTQLAPPPPPASPEPASGNPPAGNAKPKPKKSNSADASLLPILEKMAAVMERLATKDTETKASDGGVAAVSAPSGNLAGVKSRLSTAGYSDAEIAAKLAPHTHTHHEM